MPKRRILEKLKITEISGVDRPAMPHALVTCLKRAQEEPTMNSFAALEDRVLILKDRADVLITKTLADRTEPAAPIPDFEAVVAAIEKRDACGGTEAMSKARREAPDAFQVYRRLVPKKPTKETDHDDFENLVAAGARKSAPAADFMAEVDATMIAKRLTRTAAMSEVRRREPELFVAYQKA